MKKLKIDIYSDLHLDTWGHGYHDYNENIFQFKPTKGTDVCLFAGDAGNGPLWYSRAMRMLKSRYQKVIGVPGNHDYYGTSLYEGMINLEYHDPGNTVHVIDDFIIVASTFWTNFRYSEVSKLLAEKAITDFRAIPNMNGDLMTCLNQDAIHFLSDYAGRADVVMTHFPPLIQSEHPAYMSSSQLNPYFVNDEHSFVEAMRTKLWVHGHSHKKFDYTFKDTRVVANPIGYKGEEQNEPIFIPKHVEITKDV